LPISAVFGSLEGCAAVLGPCINVGPLGQKEFDHISATGAGGPYEGCLSIFTLRINISAIVKEAFDYIHVPISGSKHEGLPAPLPKNSRVPN